jgi:predicted lipoprotein with Yx(FWY)xxD motif
MGRLFALSLSLLVLGIGACGEDDDASMAAPEASTTSHQAAPGSANGDEGARSLDHPAPQPGTEIVVADSAYGSMLFNAEQQAIYLFDKEESDAAQCYGDCAAAWPPVLTDGEPQAGDGAQAKLLGTTERDDGTTQLTYNGHPLYYYAHEGPGQVLCHNIAEFGGLWLVVQPKGDAAPA